MGINFVGIRFIPGPIHLQIIILAFNYGSRDEIVNAAKHYAVDYKEGKINDLTEDSFKNYLFTKDLPEVDLVIRTANEKRLSNFLLWQCAYAEFVFVDEYWPDFTNGTLDKCISEYNNRKRNFGGRALTNFLIEMLKQEGIEGCTKNNYG